MKALSIQQPWAAMIVQGWKPVENRTWSTKHRGKFLIHAGRTFDREGLEWIRWNSKELGLPETPAFWDELENLSWGGIVGAATLVDVVTEHASPWFCGPVGFVIDKAYRTPFVPIPGRLGFWDVDEAGRING